ncbi:MAG: CHAT domain-containing protein [Xanthomonadales bacterium]|nr:CHAT domain-containing protein [Xanthomonadales bacterium]
MLSLEFDAAASESYLIEIEQGGLDLVVTVEDPSGETVSFNSPLLRDESELLVVDSSIAGVYSLSMLSPEYTGAIASVTIQLSKLTGSATKARERLAGLRQVSEASRLNQQQNLAGWTAALQAYKQANEHFLASGDGRNLARSLFSMATIEYWQMSQWDRSASLAARAAELYRKNGNAHLAANAIQLQAAALVEKALEVEKSESIGLAPEARLIFDQALGLFRQALETQESQGFHYDAARITNNIGYTWQQMGDLDSAAPFFHRAAAYYRETEQWQDELAPLSNLAVIDIEKANLISALNTYKRMLVILPPGKANRARAQILANLGAAQLSLHQLTDALQSYSQALSLQREIDDINGQGYSLAGIGTTYYSLGQQELAHEYLETAYTAAQEANNGASQVSVLKFIGKIELLDGDSQAALKAHKKALRLVTTPMDQANIRLQISEDLVAGGKAGKAVEMLALIRGAAKESRNPKRLADSLRVSGDAWLKTGQFAESLRAFQDAAILYQALGLGAEQSHAIFGAAHAARELGRTEQALEQARLAIRSVENLRSQLIAPQFRTFFLATRQKYYAFLIDILMDLHAQSGGTSDQYLREAFSVSERSRARALVDLIGEASIRLEGPGSAGKNQEQADLYTLMAENRYRLEQLLDKPPEAGLDSRVMGLKQDLARIENELNLLQIEMRVQNPGYASLTAPTILDAGQVQQMLDADSVLLQYKLGDNRSFVFRVTRNSLEAHVLPGRKAIEQKARQLRSLLKAPAFSAADRAELANAVNELSRQILKPVGGLNQHRVLVVADGVLHYLPFSVLNNHEQRDANDSLLAGHEIINLPSMSVLSAQRINHKGRYQPTRQIAVFADPVFSAADSRFGDLPQGNPLSKRSRDLNTLPLDNPAQLKRLPATAKEAESIISLVDPDQSLLALGFASSLTAVMNSNLEDYRIIHFATHGRIDSRYPALSELVFSQIDERGNRRDGSLRLHDIYNLRLKADLVAMSACDTALGRQIAGEGLTGLTQGFIFAGSRSVLASLWQVPDRATAELMSRFYQNLLDKNQKPATALRNAQLELASTPRWRSPYFWSGFVLQGEWL